MQALEYKLGRFTLQPHRQLLEAGVPVAISRKPLDLLSVLAEAEGALVTKDELMATVWPNTIVEENALQAHIAALRKLLGADANLLSTTRGLGYRLAAAPQSAPAHHGSEPTPHAPTAVPNLAPAHEPPRRGFVVSAFSAAVPLIAIVAAGLWPTLHGRPPWQVRPPPGGRVAVVPFDVQSPDAETRSFADGLHDAISGTLSFNQAPVVSKEDSEKLRGANAEPEFDRLNVDLLLKGDVRRVGDVYDVHADMDDVREHVILWSDEFKGPVTAPQALQTAVAAQMGDVAYWASVARSGPVRPDAAALAAFIAGRESTTGVRNGADGVDLADYRKVVAEAPDFSWGHSGVAAAEGFEFLDQAPGEKDEQLRIDGRREAQRALQLEPHNGEAYLALELLTPRTDFKAREALLLQGAAVDPGFDPVELMEGRLLWSAGRGQEALGWFQRAHAIDPLHGGASFSLALNLASEGRSAESQDLLSRMETQWPGLGFTRAARFWTSVAEDSPAAALAALDTPNGTPSWIPQPTVDTFRTALKALQAGNGKAKRKAAAAVVAAAREGWAEPGQAALLLAMLGDLDDAFVQAAAYRPADPAQPPYLFLPPAAPLRADRRFMQLAKRLGLVAYWRKTDRWPDFCREPGLPYNCRAEAAKVGG